MRSRRIRGPGLLAALVLVLAGAGSLPASALPESSSLTGAVVAPDGTGLPGSVVTLVPAGGGAPLRVVAGERGVFRARGLAAGSWFLTAESAGFSPKTLPEIRLAPGESKEATVTLSVPAVRESVAVIGNAPRDSVEAAGIRESPARDVGEALESTAGVWKLRKGGIANEVVVRGYQTKDLNVLIDGQRIYGACPGHMDPPAFHADFAEVDRIEVGKGPFDVKNQGSLGGVVNIVTRQPDEGWHATANFAAGSAGYLNPAATVSFGSASVSGLAGFSWRGSDAYTDGSGKRFTEVTNYKTAFVDASAFQVGTAWGKLRFAPAAGHGAELSWTHQEADQVFYPALQMDSPWDRSDRLNLLWDFAAGGTALDALKFQSYFTQVNHFMTDQFRTSAGSFARGYSMATTANSQAVGGKLEAGLFKELTAGVEVFHRHWETINVMAMSGFKETYTIPGATTDFAGFYAEWKHPLSATVSLGAGARMDWSESAADPAKANTDLYWAYNGTRSTSRSDAFPSGHVRVFFRPSDGLEISGGLGSNVRVAEPNERYYAAKKMGSDWVGNPDLAPVRNSGVDVAVSLRGKGLYGSVSFFANQVSNYVAVHEQPKINMAPGVMNTTAKSYANVDATLLGGEATAVATLTDRLFLSGDVSYVYGSQDADPSKNVFSTDLAEMPPLRGRVAARYDTGRFFGEAEGVFSAAQNRVDTDLEEQPTAGWGIANLKAGASYAGFTLTAGVSNLFDRFYYESLSYQRDPYRSGIKIPEPGRVFFVNLAWRF